MRIGIFGLKGHQSVVFQGARELGGCQIVAVSDDDPQKLRKFCEQEPLAREAESYANAAHLIEHAMLDLCVVCDENGLRAEQLLALLARDIHVVTEKPLATTLADLQRLREAFARSKSKLTMLLTMRHEPKYGAVRKLVQDGAIGNVCQVTTQKSYRVEERDAWQKSRQRLGGTIPFIGIHSLDMVRWTTGLDFTHIAAFHGNGGTPYLGETEDQASILARLTNGASVTARLDYLRPSTMPTHGDDRLRIAGSDGIIEVRSDLHDSQLVTRQHGPREIKAEPVENFFVSFVRSIRNGTPQVIPPDDCFSITEIVLRARDAADGMQMVALETRKNEG